jgi:hypothetical protein
MHGPSPTQTKTRFWYFYQKAGGKPRFNLWVLQHSSSTRKPAIYQPAVDLPIEPNDQVLAFQQYKLPGEPAPAEMKLKRESLFRVMNLQLNIISISRI